MTVSTHPMTPAVCMRDPHDVRGHWINLDELNPNVHRDAIIDYEYFPHDYVNLPTSADAFTLWQDIYEEVKPSLWPAFLQFVNDGNGSDDGNGLPDATTFIESYRGHNESFDDYFYDNLAGDIESMLESCPEVIRQYFGWCSYIDDVRLDYTVLPAPGSGYFIYVNL